MSKVQDKRTKLTATFLNSIATAMVVAGAVVPFATFTYELPGAASGQAIILVGGSLVLMARGLSWWDGYERRRDGRP